MAQPIRGKVPPLKKADLQGAGKPSAAGEKQDTAILKSSADAGGFEAFIQLEADARRAKTEKELFFHIANETRKLVPYRQAVLMRRRGARGPYRAAAVSSLAVVDRNVPLIRWFERIVRNLDKDSGVDKTQEFTLPAFSDPNDEETQNYPFVQMLWVPLKSNGAVVGGMLMARESAWRESSRLVAERLADVYAHAWRAIVGPKKLVRRSPIGKLGMGILCLGLIAAGFIQVPLTVLAPVEVVANDPIILAAPLNGVIDDILVDPNAPAMVGMPLVRFVDTNLRNEFEVSERAVQVADARYRRAAQGAFGDPRAKREIAIAKAELALAKSQRDYAADLLKNVVITAPSAGIVIFSDKRDWIGRPVSIGEQIMQIADPAHIEFEVKLPVGDAIALSDGARIKVFLDAAPLDPIEAVLTHASYHAQPDDAGTLSYTVIARLKNRDSLPSRIGARGAAQVFGEQVSLYFLVFRRPIAAFRQFFGL